MAPKPLTYRPPTTTLTVFTTMSSPTTKLSASILKSGGKKPSTASSFIPADGTQFVTIGRDDVAVSVPSMAGINDPPYQKAACFHALSTTAYGLLDSYPPSTVMMFVSQQIPVDTSMALTETTAIASAIKSSLCDTRFLNAVSFINKKWRKVTTPNSEELRTRAEGLYGVHFQCMIDGPSLDPRIRHDRSFSSDFILLLPQHQYSPSSGDVTEVSTPQRPSASPAGTLFADRPSISLFSTPTRPRTGEESKSNDAGDENDPEEPLLLGQRTPGSARMANLFTQSVASGTKLGYYGKFNFMDSQELFDACFGKSPQLFSPSMKDDLWDGSNNLTSFMEACKFDLFMQSCQVDYVGSVNVSRECHVREVCNNITKLKQVWKDENGKKQVDTPEELYQKFIKFAVSLPDNTDTWTIQLPSAFLTALDDKIKRKVHTSSFVMPTPTSLRTKNDQINGTRLLKNEATRIYDDLAERAEELQTQLALMTKSPSRPPASTPSRVLLGVPHDESTFVGSAYNSTSLAEETLQKYKGGNSDDVNSHPDVEIRSFKGVAYPFHKPSSFLSDFPTTFRGCYICGSSEHWRKDHCPTVMSGKPYDRRRFFKNLWAHRPNTYTNRRQSPGSNERALVAHSGMYTSPYFTTQFEGSSSCTTLIPTLSLYSINHFINFQPLHQFSTTSSKIYPLHQFSTTSSKIYPLRQFTTTSSR